MRASMKLATFVSTLLHSRAQCFNIIHVRYYPRWTHRKPIGIVENSISDEEKTEWKLRIEREVIKYPKGTDSKLNSFTRDALYDNPSVSVSSELLKSRGRNEDPSVTLKSRKDKESTEFTYSNSKSTSANYNHTIDQDNNSSVKSQKTDDDNKSIWTQRNFFKGSANENAEKSVNVLPVTSKLSVKRKIYDSKEFEKSLKLKNSADKLGVPVFTDLVDDDYILSKYLTNTKSKKKRDKSKYICLEGKRLVEDAVKAGFIPEAVFFSRIKDLKDLNLPQEGVNIYKMFYKKLCLWSDVSTSQGVLAILKMPNISGERSSFLPLTVICDNIRDPGNLGAILRVCAGVGCKKVVLMKGCTDLWEPKVLRAGAGAHFRLSVDQVEDWDVIREKMNSDSLVFIAENNISNVRRGFKSKPVGGNELHSGSESESDSKDDVNLQTLETTVQSSDFVLPIALPYYGFRYTSASSVVLIVGGETEGVSSEAYKLVSEVNGVRLHIPLSNDVESLNSAAALSVIAFEIKKQFLMQSKDNVVVDNTKTAVRNA